MNPRVARTILPSIAAAGALLGLSACGGSLSGGADGAAGSTALSGRPAGTATVALRQIQGTGSVLVDSRGDALYFNNHGARGDKIACTGSCTSVWPPLTLRAGTAAPVAAAGLGGKLGVVQRPDGTRQVTWNGKPLYTFVEDGGPGMVTGDGAMDAFGGTSFTWHVAGTARTTSSGGRPTQRGGY